MKQAGMGGQVLEQTNLAELYMRKSTTKMECVTNCLHLFPTRFSGAGLEAANS